MRLSEWAKKNNISYKTARRWFDDGKISGAYRISERIIIVPDEEPKEVSHKQAVVYSRVSSHDQKDDLHRQSQRLEKFAIENGYQVSKTVEEVASGMNPHRKKLIQILEDDSINTIIVENKDRLARMNGDLIIAASSKEIIIVNHNEKQTNEVQDVIDFMDSFYSRQYGKRAAKNAAQRKAEQLFEN